MRTLLLIAPLGLLAACGDGKKVCTEAADRYEGCIAKVVGAELAAHARSKRKEGIAACAKDTRTVKMYRACLPEKDCEKFLKCLEDYAAKHGP